MSSQTDSWSFIYQHASFVLVIVCYTQVLCDHAQSMTVFVKKQQNNELHIFGALLLLIIGNFEHRQLTQSRPIETVHELIAHNNNELYDLCDGISLICAHQ